MTTRKAHAAHTADELVFRVVGTPAPQGSKRHVGRGVMVESSTKVKPWREAVVAAVMNSYQVHADHNGDPKVDYYPFGSEPVAVDVIFAFARPKHHYRTGRNAHLLRDTAPSFVATKPDLDKLLRSTLDALTLAGVVRDDAQVAMVIASKVYLGGRMPELKVPGALIIIRRVS